MSSIHQSHSRKELSEITEIFNLNVTNYNKLNKKDLAKSLLYQLSTISEIKEDNDYYFVKNKQELIDYLVNPDCSKNLTVKEKTEVMDLSKYIIQYCKNDFFLSYSPFLDYDDMIKKAKYIAGFGDIPSVRRAITLLNKDTKLSNKIDVIMSSRTKKRLERSKRVKQKFMGGLTFKRGKYVITFD